MRTGSVESCSASLKTIDFRATSKQQLNDLEGRVVEGLGFCTQWNEHCVTRKAISSWRNEGDPLADEVADVLDLRPGDDSLEKLEAHMRQDAGDQDPAVQRFWQSATADRPFAHGTSGQSPPASILARGQEVFRRYSLELFISLLHFSLVVDFSAPKIHAVLRSTSYLTSANRDVTYRRLMETTQFVMDAFTDMTPITGIGWRSTIRVRLLHAQVRRRIRNGSSKLDEPEKHAAGLPINQEDLALTLGAFAVAPLWSLRKMGYRLSAEERLAYITYWSLIGSYLGVDTTILDTWYRSANAESSAEKLFLCQLWHLYANPSESSDLAPSAKSSVPQPAPALSKHSLPANPSQAYHLLSSVSIRPPLHFSLGTNIYLTYLLIGPDLFRSLGLPSDTPLSARIRTHFVLSACWIGLKFGALYPRREWEERRRRMSWEVMVVVVKWALGSERTRFTGRKGNACRPLSEGAAGSDKIDDDWELLSYRGGGTRRGKDLNGEFYLLVAEFIMASLAFLGLLAWSVHYLCIA